MTDIFLMMFFPSLVVAAGIGDFLTMRIPNWLNLAIALSMPPIALLAGMPLHVLGWHLLAGVVMLVIGFGLFAGRFIGGGDAKLIAAAALWIGWTQLLLFVIITSLAGGVLAILMKLWQLLRIEHQVKDFAWLKQLFRRDLQLPYGAAIAVGAAWVYPLTWWWIDRVG